MTLTFECFYVNLFDNLYKPLLSFKRFYRKLRQNLYEIGSDFWMSSLEVISKDLWDYHWFCRLCLGNYVYILTVEEAH